MSRISLCAVCALLTLLGFMLGERLGAQQGGDTFDKALPRPVRATGNVVESTEDRIEKVLRQQLKAPLEFIDTPLTDVVAQLQEEYEIQIIFDHSALEEVAISPETEVSTNLRNISLKSALELMLGEPGLEDLTFMIDREVLLITTEERANQTLSIQVYRVDDFEHFSYDEKHSKQTMLCYSPVPLMKAIVNCVEFDSWMENGTGEGTLFLMKPGMLVVSQTRNVHRKIEEFLTKLRNMKAEIEQGESGSASF